jgi:hypothetical protein
MADPSLVAAKPGDFFCPRGGTWYVEETTPERRRFLTTKACFHSTMDCASDHHQVCVRGRDEVCRLLHIRSVPTWLLRREPTTSWSLDSTQQRVARWILWWFDTLLDLFNGANILGMLQRGCVHEQFDVPTWKA